KVDDSVTKSAKPDIAAVAGNRWTHMRLDQLLDCVYRPGVLNGEEFVAVRLPGFCGFALEQGFAGEEMFHYGAKNDRVQIRPFAGRFRNGNKIPAKKHARDAIDPKQGLREWRPARAVGVTDVERAMAHDLAPREKF